MLRYLLKVTSLKNLYGNSEKGQITTLLLLMAVGILAFVLVTANLGNVANTTTNLANAADSSALYLASQLATRSNQLWEALDHETEKCKKGGLLALILAIVIAIIAIVIVVATWGTGTGIAAMIMSIGLKGLMIAGAIGGAIGGAVGGAIAGTGAFRGALIGAVVGAAIGAAGHYIAVATAAAPASTLTAYSFTPTLNALYPSTAAVGEGTIFGTTAFVPAVDASIAPLAGTTTPFGFAGGDAAMLGTSEGVALGGGSSLGGLGGTTGSVMQGAVGTATGEMFPIGAAGKVAAIEAAATEAAEIAVAMEAIEAAEIAAAAAAIKVAIGQAAMSALGVAAKVYNTYVEDEMSFAAISSATKGINGLLEYDRYRENTFFQALSQTVDDSNKTDSDYVQLPVNDKTDTDGDGKINRYDPYDTDGDGNKEEAVPYFQYWWDLRVRALKSIIPELEALTYLFLWGEESEEYNTAAYREPYNPSLSKPQESSVDYEHSFQDYAVNQYSETYACAADTLGGSSVSSSLCSAYYSVDGGGYGYSPVWSSGLIYRSGLSDWKRWIKCPNDYQKNFGEDTSCKTNLTVDSNETDKVLVPVIDGVIVQVGKALEDRNNDGKKDKDAIEVSFYEPGLTDRSDYDGEQEECKKKRDEKTGKVVDKNANGKTVYTCKGSKKDCEKNDDGTYTCGGKLYNENKGCAKNDDGTYTCDDDMYNDEAEVVVSTLIDFKEAVKIIKSQSITRLTSTWQSWVTKFYDSDKEEVEDECGEIQEKDKTKSMNFSDKFDKLIDGEDLDNDGETGEEDVDVPIDSDNDGDTDYYEVKDEFKGLKAWKKEIKEGKKKLKNKINTCGDIGYLDDDGACNDYCYGRYGDGSGCTTCYKDVPCILDSGGITTDNDIDDEFDEALAAIDSLISNLEAFQKSVRGEYRCQDGKCRYYGGYYNDMNDVYKTLSKKYGQTFDFGGKSPVTYSWADSRCLVGKTFEKDTTDSDNDGNITELDMMKLCGKDTDGDGKKDTLDANCPYMDTCDQDADGDYGEQYKCHSVTVEASQFKIPYIDEQKSGGFLMKKVCMVLTDYCYDPNGKGWCKNSDAQNVWIKITRKDLGNQTLGSLGDWNAMGTGDENQCAVSPDCADWKEKNPGFKISRKAIPYFSYNKVGLASAGKEEAKK
ncbi:MAG: hypothetical protein Q7J72_03905 [Candidatus Omnitrophota bacterium]|nr:hypothetical protein [Candidatus Omnitrophota bacterium]